MSIAVNNFSTLKENNTGLVYIICDQEYKYHHSDSWIKIAIEFAECWAPSEVNYERIVWLRYWLRENDQHGHDLGTSHLTSLKACKEWIDAVIRKEFTWNIESPFFKDHLEENKRIFEL